MPLLNLLWEEFFLLLFSAGTLILSLKREELPHISSAEWKVLLFLLSLMVVIKGFELSGVLKYLALKLERFKNFPLLLVLYTAILAAFVTNDVALLAVVPLTLLLRDKTLIPLLVVLEIIAANIGSALSPFGNPQNIYLFHFYGLRLGEFLNAVFPVFLPLLVFLLVITPKSGKERNTPSESVGINPPLLAVSTVGFILFLGSFFGILPHLAAAAVLLLGIWKPKLLKVDFNLLLTFLAFFAFSSLLKVENIFTSPKGVLLGSALWSQILSNVPVAVLMAKFTPLWKPLLLGTNIGGFGTPVASMANLIGIRLYLRSGLPRGLFFYLFAVLNFAFLTMGVSLGLLTLERMG